MQVLYIICTIIYIFTLDFPWLDLSRDYLLRTVKVALTNSMTEALPGPKVKEAVFEPTSFHLSISVIPHTPWVEWNFPIPPGIHAEVCAIVQKKMTAGIYEPLNSSYQSRWFCVLKKDGEVLQPVHSLEPLSWVTIQHLGVPPIPEHLVECFGGCAVEECWIYVRYNERLIAESSQDYTTFQTPFSTLQLVTLPMGWTNSVPIFHDNITFILQAEIPHITLIMYQSKVRNWHTPKVINPMKLILILIIWL
jgi:hypothetical protein